VLERGPHVVQHARDLRIAHKRLDARARADVHLPVADRKHEQRAVLARRVAHAPGVVQRARKRGCGRGLVLALVVGDVVRDGHRHL
jgi:hypothetical protein